MIMVCVEAYLPWQVLTAAAASAPSAAPVAVSAVNSAAADRVFALPVEAVAGAFG
jgi:hypothetical protein